MLEKYRPLFEPFTIGGLEVKNRFALSPMAIVDVDENYQLTSEAIDYYAERAKGGAGLIFTGAINMSNNIEKHGTSLACILANPAASLRNIRKLSDRIHAYGAKLFVQISFGQGRNGPPMADSTYNIAPSECANYWNPKVMHRALTSEEIYTMIEEYGKAAQICQRAGADGVELHALHGGYLIDCFAMERFNQREDEFGGSAEKRARLPVALREEVRKQCGNRFPMSVRLGVKSFISGHQKSAIPGDDFEELGRDLEESLELATRLTSGGYDMLNVDVGSYDGGYWGKPPYFMPSSTYLPYAKMVKELVDIPVICSGRLGDPEHALKAITSGSVDMVSMARPFLADPDYVNKLASGRLEDIRPCLSCGAGCLARRNQNRTISCAVNPQSNRERETRLMPAVEPKTVLVIGGGPAGMEFARVAAIRGHQVCLAEKSGSLGGNFYYASRPGFKDEDKALLAWYERQLEKLEVAVTLNDSVAANDPRISDADIVVTATGSNPFVPNLPGTERALSALQVLDGKATVGEKCIIVGGGQVGCELAIWLCQQGKQVSLVEMADKLMAQNAPNSINYQNIVELLEHYKVDIQLGAKLLSVESDGVIVEQNGSAEKLIADDVILAIGFRSERTLYEQIRTIHGRVYNMGDSNRPSEIMAAIWDAFEVASNL